MSQDLHLSIWEGLQKELIERYREKQLEEEELHIPCGSLFRGLSQTKN